MPPNVGCLTPPFCSLAFAQIAHLLEAVRTHASYATAFLAMRVLNVLIGLLGVLPYVASRRQILSAVEDVRKENAGTTGEP